jgi:hypothetical protein
MSRKLKFKPKITQVKLNPEQAVLACVCYNQNYDYQNTTKAKYSTGESKTLCDYWGVPRNTTTGIVCTQSTSTPLSSFKYAGSTIS